MRNQFEAQLETLHMELIRMGALCEEAISAAATAYLEGDLELGQRAIALEREIDHKEEDIQQQCTRLLLRQQPVARDLRTVSAALHMISDMERIGDQAADIAELARQGAGCRMRDIPMKQMAEAAIHMVTDSVDAFVRRDMELAHSVIVQDDGVDALFQQVRNALIARIAAGENGEDCLDVLMTAKYLERIGDHATNIAQWVEYAQTGQYEAD